MKAWGFAGAVALAGVFAAPGAGAPLGSSVCAECVRATMQTLAGEALHGRRCGTADENAAARYLADALARQHIAGALPGGAYLQPVELRTQTYAAPPKVEFVSPDGHTIALTHGEGALVADAPPALDGELVRISDPDAPLAEVRGKVLILQGMAGTKARQAARAGAAALVIEASDALLQRWSEVAQRPPGPVQVTDTPPRAAQTPVVFLRPEVFQQLAAYDGGRLHVSAPRGEPVVRTSYNVLGVRHGSAADADRQAVLLTAHYDHLGVRGGQTFHGANDDASGTAAVMEFARILGRGKAHRRTVYFGLFGCEEEGELGAKYYLAHPPAPVADLVANLEFEMIGVDDPKRPGFLMLTGWDRTDLGPVLQAHGARIGPDLYPDENFFERSDNYQLALKGVVAQTISAWPVPPTYHAPTDDLAHVDLELMDRTIGSLIGPVTWLIDHDFRPAWNPGKRP